MIHFVCRETAKQKAKVIEALHRIPADEDKKVDGILLKLERMTVVNQV